RARLGPQLIGSPPAGNDRRHRGRAPCGGGGVGADGGARASDAAPRVATRGTMVMAHRPSRRLGPRGSVPRWPLDPSRLAIVPCRRSLPDVVAATVEPGGRGAAGRRRGVTV